DAPYPFYDRWGDSFNVNTEFVIVNQARALATLAFLMAQTPLKNQPSRTVAAQLEVRSAGAEGRAPRRTAALVVPGRDLRQARIVWETQGAEPAFGSTFAFTPANGNRGWVEAEAQWPD